MVVLAGKNQEVNSLTVRVGFTASRKIGKAIARNRAKRRLRVLAAEIVSEIGLPGYDYVLIAREKTLTGAFDALKQDLRIALLSIHGKIKPKPLQHDN